MEDSRRKDDTDMEHKIAVIPGDGIGPEIVAEACKGLNAAAAKFARIIIMSNPSPIISSRSGHAARSSSYR